MRRLGSAAGRGGAVRGCALVAVVVLVAGCGGATTSTSPLPSVTVSPGGPVSSSEVSASVSMSGSASSGRPSASSSSGADAALVAEASDVFTRYQKAYIAWQMKGGSATLPKEIADLTAPPLSTQVQQLLAKQKLDGWRLSGAASPNIVILGPLSSLHTAGSALTLHTCVDARRAQVVYDSGKRQPGKAFEYHSYFKVVNGDLRYFDTESREVDSCAGL